jgi:hypothetical protein
MRSRCPALLRLTVFTEDSDSFSIEMVEEQNHFLLEQVKGYVKALEKSTSHALS